MDVLWVHGYLEVPFVQVYLGKDLAASNPEGEVHHVQKRVGVWYSDNVEAPKLIQVVDSYIAYNLYKFGISSSQIEISTHFFYSARILLYFGSARPQF